MQDDIAPYVRNFEAQSSGARILLKEVEDPARFGVPVFDGDRIVAIEEKPAQPEEPLRGHRHLYVRRPRLRLHRTLTPSQRGELEIADVHNRYIAEGDLFYDVLDGAWSDAGTFESLFRASELVARERAKLAFRVRQ